MTPRKPHAVHPRHLLDIVTYSLCFVIVSFSLEGCSSGTPGASSISLEIPRFIGGRCGMTSALSTT